MAQRCPSLARTAARPLALHSQLRRSRQEMALIISRACCRHTGGSSGQSLELYNCFRRGHSFWNETLGQCLSLNSTLMSNSTQKQRPSIVRALRITSFHEICQGSSLEDWSWIPSSREGIKAGERTGKWWEKEGKSIVSTALNTVPLEHQEANYTNRVYTSSWNPCVCIKHSGTHTWWAGERLFLFRGSPVYVVKPWFRKIGAESPRSLCHCCPTMKLLSQRAPSHQVQEPFLRPPVLDLCTIFQYPIFSLLQDAAAAADLDDKHHFMIYSNYLLHLHHRLLIPGKLISADNKLRHQVLC